MKLAACIADDMLSSKRGTRNEGALLTSTPLLHMIFELDEAAMDDAYQSSEKMSVYIGH